jgi:high mobility group protein B1
VCKALSKTWKLLTDEEKMPYHDAQKQDKKRYEDQKANLSKKDILFLRRVRRQKREARGRRPKPPLSAYMLFVRDRRSIICAGIDPRDFAKIGRALGRAWSDLLDTEREQYTESAREAREKYRQELEQFKMKKKNKT